MLGESSDRYRITMPGRCLARLRAWSRRAKRLGLQIRWRDCLREIYERLSKTPNEWGEALRRLRGSGAVQYHAAHDLLHVKFSVHEQSRVVIVWSVLIMPNTPLDVDAEGNGE